MLPAFEPDDWVVARRLRSAPTRGDVVVFTHASYPDRNLLKRVIGLPGERIAAVDGELRVDGDLLADPWADGPMCADSEDFVEGDSVWVLGDNRCGPSVDSRILGPIPVGDIGWRVVARYWPPSRAGRV